MNNNCENKKNSSNILSDINNKIGFVPEVLKIIEEINPSFIDHFTCCNSKIFTDGALSAKIKTLLALVLVASKNCDECVYSQMKNALNFGATKEEIMEALSVLMILSGTTSIASCKNALKLLIEK